MSWSMLCNAVSLLLVIPVSHGVGQFRIVRLDLPDSDIVTAYEQSAVKNVLAAVNPKIFVGYWSVCADGKGFGYGNSYPSLDGHQITDALLWLDQVKVVKANWDYVRSFQRSDGLLPLAILPSEAGKKVGEGKALAEVSKNGGLYEHWVPGNPLGALASPTYIQNADVIYRATLDKKWLTSQISSINLAADYLAALTTEEGAVKGAGYYMERPARIESDGVTQCYAVDAFRRVAALDSVCGDGAAARRYLQLAERIRYNFVTRFWVNNHFAEYFNPEHGLITKHGLTDVDWAAIATDVATEDQRSILWPELKDNELFHYGGMPTGIATLPESYEDWEFTHPDRHDVAAMGRVWYLEAWARARMGDAGGLLDGIRKVSQVGRDSGYSWYERYQRDSSGGFRVSGPKTYCEYPANLIRIVQRFLFGVDLRLDGSVVLAPTVTGEFWQRGFGETLNVHGCTLSYRFLGDRIEGTYSGAKSQRLGVRFRPSQAPTRLYATVNGQTTKAVEKEGVIFVGLPETTGREACKFQIVRKRTVRP